MRATITLESDVKALLDEVIAERNFSFEQAVDFAIREGLSSHKPQRTPYIQPVFDLGQCRIPGNHRVQALSDFFEDEEILRKMDMST